MSDHHDFPPGSGADFPPLENGPQLVRKPDGPLSAVNTVTVSPGGATFPTITAALASIEDAWQGKQYLVSIGPGTYAEQILCKPWVFLQGSGIGVTAIVATITNPGLPFAINAASNSAIQDMSVQAAASGDVPGVTCIVAYGAENFSIENCVLTALDNGHKVTRVTAIVADYNSPAPKSVIYVSYSTVSAYGSNAATQPVGFIADRGAFVQFTESKLDGRAGQSAFGGLVYSGCYVLFESGVIEGSGYALANLGPNSTVIARGCTISGPTYNVDIEPA